MKWFFRKKKSLINTLWERLKKFDLSRNELDRVIESCAPLAEAAFGIWVKEANANELRGALRSKHEIIRRMAGERILEQFANCKDALCDILKHRSGPEAGLAWEKFIGLASDEDLARVISDHEYCGFGYTVKAAEVLLSRQPESRYLKYAIRSAEHQEQAWERLQDDASTDDLAWIAANVEEYAEKATDRLLAHEVVDPKHLLVVARRTNSEEILDRVWSALPPMSVEQLVNAVEGVYGDQPIISKVWETIFNLSPSDEELFRIVWKSFSLREYAWAEVKSHPNLDPHDLASIIDRQHELRDEAWALLLEQPMSEKKTWALAAVIESWGYGEKYIGLEKELLRGLQKYKLDARRYNKIIEYSNDERLKKLASRRLLDTKEGILDELARLGEKN